MSPITVLLAEDHMIFREGLRSLLKSEKDIEVVGEAATGREAVELARTLRPDVVVMDISMPLLNGLEATRQIIQSVPGVKVLVLSAHRDDVYIEQVREVGAAGYLVKRSSFQALAKAIREVFKGNTFFHSSVAKRNPAAQVRKPFDRGMVPVKRTPYLTSREAEILQLVVEGNANKQVAEVLGISIKTVEKHRRNLMEKLDLHDIASLTRYAIAAGVIESGAPT